MATRSSCEGFFFGGTFGADTFLTRGQKIIENSVDPFTKNKVEQTSWEVLRNDFTHSTHFSIRKIDASVFFEFKAILGSGGTVFAIDKGDAFMFMLDNDSVVTLSNEEFTLTGYGDGAVGFAGSEAQGINVRYELDPAEMEILSKYPLKKFRFYTTKDYFELEVKKDNASILQKALKLIH